ARRRTDRAGDHDDDPHARHCRGADPRCESRRGRRRRAASIGAIPPADIRPARCPEADMTSSRFRLSANLIPLLATVGVCALLYGIGCVNYEGFGRPQVFINFFGDNAHRGIAAVGMTFVILSGGIDLSVGSMIALAGIVIAVLTEQYHWPPALVIPLVLAGGAAFGAMQGSLIHFFK